MVRLYIDVSEAEKAEFIRKATEEGKTHREKVLDDAGIIYEKRIVGRPTLDEIKVKMEIVRQKLLVADYAKYIASMPTRDDVNEKRKKLDDIFKDSQARRLGR